MPVELLTGGVELIAKTVREFQSVFNETANLVMPPIQASGESRLSEMPPRWSVANDNDIGDNNPTSNSQEFKTMYDDCDSGNNDELKYVSYSIVFRKRDFEATLKDESQELIDYPLSTFCNLKVADYLHELATPPHRTLPREWQTGNHPVGDYGYLPANTRQPDSFSRIPVNEQKWIECLARVVKNVDKAEKEYDRTQTEAQLKQARTQEDIADVLREISEKIG
jgi:hypothetical protein